MKHTAVLLLAMLLAGAVGAAEADIRVHQPWIAEGPPGAQVLAGYLVLENTSDRPRHLMRVKSPDFQSAMLHRTVMEDGMARMIHQDRLTLEPGTSLELIPGGYHLMLMQPSRGLKVGDTVVLILEFDDAEILQVDAQVRRVEID